MERRDAAWFRRAAAAERAKAAAAISRAELWERTAAELEALRGSEHGRKVNSSMLGEHRTAISAGRAPKDLFVAALNDRGYTLRSLAKLVGVAPATLHAHRKPKADTNHRPIPQGRADKVEKLTGWPADAAHWPAGIVSS